MLTTRYFGPRTLPLHNEAVGAFVSRQIWGEPDGISAFCSMGVFDGDRLVAGTLYHNWQRQEGVIELSSASTTKRWLTKPVIRAMFHLPFNLLDCYTSVLRVSEKNEAMVRIAQSFGFTGHYIPHLRGRDGGEWVFIYTADEWAGSSFNDGGAHG